MFNNEISRPPSIQEYWINVYSPAPYCYENLNREMFIDRMQALVSALNIRAMLGFSVSYRIHVKLKPKKVENNLNVRLTPIFK